MELLQQTGKGQTSGVARNHSAGCFFTLRRRILCLCVLDLYLFLVYAHVSVYIWLVRMKLCPPPVSNLDTHFRRGIVIN